MQKNLVIVESPTKAKTLEKFLGGDYKVMCSKGHIRDLKKKDFGIDLDNFIPEYEIPEEQEDRVRQLQENAAKAQNVWLASDEDREGEAISWHLAQVLGLDVATTKRIVFHEITKTAILEAIDHPRTIDLNLVNAQQARRVLDRIVGFKLSPVLWKKIKPSLSAGRVQSVSVRLIVEREREIESFKSESSFKVSALFLVEDNGQMVEMRADLSQRFKTKEEARQFLEAFKGRKVTVCDISKKPTKKNPAPPFTTSTLQQEAARKLGFTVSQTMMIAQRLYESGLITYMRTDSVNLSSLCINACNKDIRENYGEQYAKVRKFHTNAKGAQEAHEAIRPTYIDRHEITGTMQDKRLYDLIWKRTVASQMADADAEKTTVRISIEGMDEEFTAVGEIITFDGFLKLYRESSDTDAEMSDEGENSVLPNVIEGQNLTLSEALASQHFTQPPLRYTEASLVKKMEELGIGRPSTYAPTISTIQQREYVEKGNKNGVKRSYTVLKLMDGKIAESVKNEVVGNEKAKLLPTDIGVVVNDFLMQYFPEIMDYNFTANVEKDFDDIAEGNAEWQKVIKSFYDGFRPLVEKTMTDRSEHKVGERVLGTDPASGKPVSVKIGRFGPVVQIGDASDAEKPRFAQLNKDQSIQTLTLEQALALFQLPRTIGEYEGSEIFIGTGRFGPYILHNSKYTSIPKNIDPMAITVDEAVSLINQKLETEQKKHLKAFEDEPGLEIRNGRYGAYLFYNDKNYKLPKNAGDPMELTAQQCLDIIREQEEKPASPRKGRRSVK